MKALTTMQQQVASKSAIAMKPSSPASAKVVPFPDRSCTRCPASARIPTSHHPSMAYAEFSFLPIALQRWRERNGLKISAAAEELGVAPSAWGHWETGYRFPTGSVLLALVQYTGLSLVELLCEHGECCPSHEYRTSGQRFLSRDDPR
jgi:DNA-binding transcriptional regulator YiaG